MNPATALDWIRAAVAAWPNHADQLRDLDAATGDGDLGVTITRGCAAVIDAMQTLPTTATPSQLCRAAGAAFAKGSPSTFGALTGAALLAASRATTDHPDYNRETAEAVLHTVTTTIMQRGQSDVGDKTVIDPLAASLQTLRTAPGAVPDVLAAMAAAARRATQETALLVARKGRAAWMQQRTAGHVDAGAMAYTCLLDELLAARPDEPPADQPDA